MRAHTITTTSRRRRNARRRRVLALGLGVCAIAIPATASASSGDQPVSEYSTPNAITGGSSDSSEPIDGWNYTILHPTTPTPTTGEPRSQRGSNGSPEVVSSYATPNAILGSDGLGEATLVSGEPANAADGFDWGSVAVGAAAAMALIALSGAALLTIRRRGAMSPSTSTN
jgi:hypothetical protein